MFPGFTGWSCDKVAKVDYCDKVIPINMNLSPSNSPLSPEEFQRQLTDFVRQHFQSGGKTAPDEAAPAEAPAGPGAEPRQANPDEFEFKHRPRDVKEYL